MKIKFNTQLRTKFNEIKYIKNFFEKYNYKKNSIPFLIIVLFLNFFKNFEKKLKN